MTFLCNFKKSESKATIAETSYWVIFKQRSVTITITLNLLASPPNYSRRSKRDGDWDFRLQFRDGVERFFSLFGINVLDYQHVWNKIDPSFVLEKTNEHPCHCHGIQVCKVKKSESAVQQQKALFGSFSNKGQSTFVLSLSFYTYYCPLNNCWWRRK